MKITNHAKKLASLTFAAIIGATCLLSQIPLCHAAQIIRRKNVESPDNPEIQLAQVHVDTGPAPNRKTAYALIVIRCPRLPEGCESMPWQLPQEMQTGDSYGWLNINEHVNFTAYSGEFGEGWRRKFTLPLNEADGTTVTWNIKLIEVSRAMPGVSLYRIEGTFTDVAAISPEFSHRDYRPICTGEINNEPPEYPI